MISRLHHEIEVADDAATLYLSGVLTAGELMHCVLV